MLDTVKSSRGVFLHPKGFPLGATKEAGASPLMHLHDMPVPHMGRSASNERITTVFLLHDLNASTLYSIVEAPVATLIRIKWGKPLSSVLASADLWLLVAGGLVYSAGVGFFLAERLPFHKPVWHGFVLVAVALQR